MPERWPMKLYSVASLQLDDRNPRLGPQLVSRAPRDIIRFLFEHDKAMEVAESIATRGYFPNEPLLAVREGKRLVVLEGNRRLAALMALRDPSLAEKGDESRLSKLQLRLRDPKDIASVPVTVAPNRRATDRQIAGRHIGTPVRAWEAENRASFILAKLEDGYSNAELKAELGFTDSDIQKARQVRAIADIARSIGLPASVQKKLDNPRATRLSPLERIIESSVGKKYLHIAPSAEHGFVGRTDKDEFARGFRKIVIDIADGEESSRSLNTSENIEEYFDKWDKDELPKKKNATFVPADLISHKPVYSPEPPRQKRPSVRQRKLYDGVLPKDFKVAYGGDRLVEIRGELVGLNRRKFPNASAVLLRVFLELAVLDYLGRSGGLEALTKRLAAKNKVNLKNGVPVMRDLSTEIVRVAKARLKQGEAKSVEKALRYDSSAPFSLEDLHSFVHQPREFPGERDILTFWKRTEPLFRMMLEQPLEGDTK